MEKAFQKLKDDGKNTKKDVIDWLKNYFFHDTAKIIDGDKVTEEKARSFIDGADDRKIEINEFKETVGKLANEQGKSVKEAFDMLADTGKKWYSAFQAGASAFKDAFKKKTSSS